METSALATDTPFRRTKQPPSDVEETLAERREELEEMSPATAVNPTPFSLGADLVGHEQEVVAIGVERAVGTAIQNNLAGLIVRQGEVARAMELYQESLDLKGQIGDVRGNGLFFGMDMVSDRQQQTPDAALAKRIVNTMREKGVLMGSIGEHGNILKLRPPLCFSKDNADMLVQTLNEVFSAG